jgi:hypothetical protein
MEAIATLVKRSGAGTELIRDPGELEPCACAGLADAYVVATENGFSPLGINLPFICADLDIPRDEIARLADWNRFENPQVSLVALPSRRKGSRLRGVVLCACETSRSYERFASARYGKPHRDFYYNVTYEAIAFAATKWAARRPAISHLSASGNFHEDIATCNVEALAHYCEGNPGRILSFVFLGCCIGAEHLNGIRRLNSAGAAGQHREIRTEMQHSASHVVIHLDWDEP